MLAKQSTGFFNARPLGAFNKVTFKVTSKKRSTRVQFPQTYLTPIVPNIWGKHFSDCSLKVE